VLAVLTFRRSKLSLNQPLQTEANIDLAELGYALSIQDHSISADMPSFAGLDEKQQLDFVDPEYATATVKLARLVGDVMTSFYNRNQMQPFIRNFSDILTHLKEWKANLPGSIRLLVGDLSATLPRHLVYLHLSINQVRLTALCFECDRLGVRTPLATIDTCRLLGIFVHQTTLLNTQTQC